jgi:hypothetical protein
MEATKPYEFIGFGAMEATKPYEFIGFGARSAISWRCPGLSARPGSESGRQLLELVRELLGRRRYGLIGPY